MSIARNQAKAYLKQLDADREREAQAARVAADLEALRALRHYLIFNAQSGVNSDALRSAIDDHAEKITGDRTALHSKDGRQIPSR